MTANEILVLCRSDDGGLAFKKPLRLGDPEQVRVMNAMNGEGMYCSHCYSLHDLDVGEIGHTVRDSPALSRCSNPLCRGVWLPGAKAVAEYVRYVGRNDLAGVKV